MVLVALILLAPTPAAAPAAKKRKPPCDFKLSRGKTHHDRVQIKMTCHRKLVVNVRFTVRKKFTVQAFKGFPGGFCSVQSARAAGCVFGGQGAPKGKAVSAVVIVRPVADARDPSFTNVQIFISGEDTFQELLGY
jgi:hypothetical protein